MRIGAAGWHALRNEGRGERNLHALRSSGRATQRPFAWPDSVWRYNRCRPATTPYCKVHLPMATSTVKPATLRELARERLGLQDRSSGRSTTTSCGCSADGEELFPGIIGYDDTVIPEINLGLIAGHDMLFLGEKGQAKSRLMRLLVAVPRRRRFPTSTFPGCPVHEDPYRPITAAGRRFVAETPEDEVPIAWWPRERALRRAAGPGHEVRRRHRRDRPGQAGRRHEHVGRGGPALRADPADAPRHLRHERAARAGRAGAGRPVQHPRRARRADPRLPDPVRHRRADPLLGQPGHVQPQRQGDPAAQGPHRLGDPHALSARAASWASRSWSRRPASSWTASSPWSCRYFMREIIEQISIAARRVEVHRPAVGRQRPVQHRQLPHDGRQRPAARRPCWASGRPCRGSATWGTSTRSSLGKLELDMMGSHQMTERQVLDAILAEAIRDVFDEYVDRHGLDEIAEIFGQGREDRGRRHAALEPVRRAAEARAARLGQGLRGERLAATRRCGPRASSSCWPACTPPTASRAQQHGRIVYEIS